MNEKTPTAVALDGATVAFRLGDGRLYTAVEKANLAVAPGEFVAIVGPTGCGKSTLLNVAAGLLKPAGGGVRIFDRALVGLNRDAGYLFQADALALAAGEHVRKAIAEMGEAHGRQPLMRACNGIRAPRARDLEPDRDIVERGLQGKSASAWNR